MKQIICCILAVVFIGALSGCTVKKLDFNKLKDIDFTVIGEEEIPEELKTQIEEGKEKVLKITYGDKGYLYMARGYGEQKTTGYSIEVRKVYESENGIYVQTELIGPSKEEGILNKKTYPYVVIKIEYSDKQVVFD